VRRKRKSALHGEERQWTVYELVRMADGSIRRTMHSRLKSYAKAKALAAKLGTKVEHG
jgi:hypothetical protein